MKMNKQIKKMQNVLILNKKTLINLKSMQKNSQCFKIIKKKKQIYLLKDKKYNFKMKNNQNYILINLNNKVKIWFNKKLNQKMISKINIEILEKKFSKNK